MSILSEASKLFTNKYFLYFMVFLASTNILGYLVTNKMNAVIFFALVSLLTYQFSKNMSVILLVAIIATNFLMTNKKIREGLENESDITTNSSSPETSTTSALNNLEAKDLQIANTMNAVKQAKTNGDVSKNISKNESSISNVNSLYNSGDKTSPNKIIDPNNQELNNKTNDEGPVAAGETLQGLKNKTTNGGPRIDYMTTIEDSYANLDKILGGDSIKNLSKDTQKLMSQQQKLFDTMSNMVPMIEGAKGMIDKLNINGLTETLNKMTLGSPLVQTNK